MTDRKITQKYFTYLEDYQIKKDPWLIEGIICNALTLLSGEPKSGKSLLAAHLAASLLTGNEILDCKPISGDHKIGWIGFDSNWKDETKTRLGNFRSKVIFFDPPNNLTTDWDWEEIAKTAITHQCTLMVIDHLYGLSDNHNLDHAHEAKASLQKIRPLYNQYGLPTLLIAQAGKGASGRAAHSVHLEGEARQLIQLDGRGATGIRTLKLIGNNSKSGTFKIKLTPESCEFTKIAKSDIQKSEKRDRTISNLPMIARDLLTKSNDQDRRSVSALARFDFEHQISGRGTVQSSRTLINYLKKANLISVSGKPKRLQAGAKLVLKTELN